MMKGRSAVCCLSLVAALSWACGGAGAWHEGPREPKQAMLSPAASVDGGQSYELTLPVDFTVDETGFRIDHGGSRVVSVRCILRDKPLSYDGAMGLVLRRGDTPFVQEQGEEWVLGSIHPSTGDAAVTCARASGPHQVTCEWEISEPQFVDGVLREWSTMMDVCGSFRRP